MKKEKMTVSEKFEQVANVLKVAKASQEVSKAIEGMEDFTPQKMTALIKKANVERVEKATNEPKKVGYKAK